MNDEKGGVLFSIAKIIDGAEEEGVVTADGEDAVAHIELSASFGDPFQALDEERILADF